MISSISNESRYSSKRSLKETNRRNHYSSLRRNETRKPLFIPSKGRDEKIITRSVSSNSLIALMIIQLCKQLLFAFDEYILYIDNFFTSTKLFKTLHTFNINVWDIAKSNSEYSFNLFANRDVITKKNS